MPVSSWVTTMTVVPCSCSRPSSSGQLGHVGRVDAGRRLVHDEQVGAAGQGAGDEHAALLPAGQRVEAGMALGPQPHVGEGGSWPPLAAARENGRHRPPGGDQAAQDGLPHRHGDAGRTGEALRDQGDALPGPEARQRRAEQPDAAVAGVLQAEDGAHERGLAAAVRAEQRDELAGADARGRRPRARAPRRTPRTGARRRRPRRSAASSPCGWAWVMSRIVRQPGSRGCPP